MFESYAIYSPGKVGSLVETRESSNVNRSSHDSHELRFLVLSGSLCVSWAATVRVLSFRLPRLRAQVPPDASSRAGPSLRVGQSHPPSSNSFHA